MPRDAGGNYTLPPGNPVASGTVISSEWSNPTMSDLGNEITNSLDRQGRGGMLVPFNNVDGSALAPGITFTLDPGLGWWRFGTGDMRASSGSEQRVRIYDDGNPLGEQVPLQVHNGNSFVNVLTDGIFADITINGVLTVAPTGNPSAGAPNPNAGIVLTQAEAATNMLQLIGSDTNITTIRMGSAADPNRIRWTYNPTTVLASLQWDGTDAITWDINADVSIPTGTLTVPSGVVANVTGNLTGNATTATSAGTATTAGSATTAGTVTTAAQPAITSVGNLTSLTVNGSIGTGGNITAGTQFLGTIGTASQPNITTVGTLTTLLVSGSMSVTSNVTAAAFFGAVNTAAQPLITSVGTLTSLTCSGNITAFSDASLKDNLLPIDNALDKIAQLVGYTYDKDGQRNAGLIANDVKKVLPEAVGEHDGLLTLNDAALTGLIINGLNECREKLNALA